MISHSKRNGITILEHCKVVVSKGRVSYIKATEAADLYYSIPYANISVIMLGSGTSITDEAARLLAEEGTLIGFAGGGGVPVFMGSLSEYRPTQYAQDWYAIWSDTEKRAASAVLMQRLRVEFTNVSLSKTPVHAKISQLGESYLATIADMREQGDILAAEGRYIKKVYSTMAKELGFTFSRDHQGGDQTNKNITNANYYCYGMAAATLWSLGIPYSLPLLHGKTRRGGLVFDLADVIKCGIPLWTAMASSSKGSEFKQEVKHSLDKSKGFDYLFDTVKKIIENFRPENIEKPTQYELRY